MDVGHGRFCVEVEPPWNSINIRARLVNRIELLGLEDDGCGYLWLLSWKGHRC